MAEILTDMESAETFKAYESYLLGQPAKAGTVLRQGAFLYIWKEKFETNGTVLQTSYGTVVTTLDSESKTLFACREFLGGRRLPSGVSAALSEKGIYIFPDELWTLRDDFAEWKREIDFTMYAVTAEEAGVLYGISGKTVASDCEKGAFKKSEARKSGKNWLITKQAADFRYGGGSEPAAPGAGHRAARMADGDRRKSGRSWIVTRDAMERLYGPPVFEKMREAVRTLI